jgi:hypothetical protein
MNKFPCTLRQAAERIGCSPSTVSRKVKALGIGTTLGLNVVLVDREEFQLLKRSITPGVRGRKPVAKAKKRGSK